MRTLEILGGAVVLCAFIGASWFAVIVGCALNDTCAAMNGMLP